MGVLYRPPNTVFKDFIGELESRHGSRGVGRGVITPPEFSKNKIEKSILEHVFSEGGGVKYLFLTILCPL